ncbi:MAG: hypothetical protein QF441_06285 [Bacteriovoracaceae bacterium]|jgi:hypothetical protein|nr:hypothetical protein [Halobacteriovoraceae bacterium]MDP7320198.1 hypothetical protein [Bacteriovoracaceae bacterium]
MTDSEKEQLVAYFEKLKDLSAEDLMKNVENHLDDEAIEIFVEHLEDFYGIEDDEELGMLAQIMISGFIAGKEIRS